MVLFKDIFLVINGRLILVELFMFSFGIYHVFDSKSHKMI